MSPFIQADFSNARVGDRVKNLCGDIGVIDCIGEKTINVSFVGENYDFNDSFTKKGRNMSDDRYPVLFYDYEGQFPTIEACTRPLPEIKVDEKVYILDFGTGEWHKRHATGLFTNDESKSIQCYKDGRDSFTSNMEFDYSAYWKLASDPTINSGNLEEIENDNK